MIKVFNKDEVKEEDYNFIVSNFILSKTEKFTYYSLMNELEEMFGEINNELKYTIEQALIRLRDDGFLSVLGATYSVKQVKI